MANIENVFRFISVRPTQLEKERGRLNMYVYKADSKSPLYNEVKKAVAAGASADELGRIANQFKTSANYVTSFSDLKFPLNTILNWITDNGRRSFKESDFIGNIQTTAGKSLDDILKDNDFIGAYNNLTDSVLADILSKTPVNEKEEKIAAIKVLYTIKSVGEKTLTLVDEEVIDDFFGRSTVIFPLLKGTAAKEQPPPPPPPPPDDKQKERDRVKEQLKNLEVAHRELSNMAVDDGNRHLPEVSTSEQARIGELETQLSSAIKNCNDKGEQKYVATASSASSMVNPARQEFILSKKAFDSLSDSTKKTLADFHLDSEKINPVKAVNRIEEEIKYLHANTESDFSYNRMMSVGGSYVDRNKFIEAVGGASKLPISNIGNIIKKCSLKAGIGDLLIVRQKLKAYELAEFAHVENALSGEFRERVHRRLDVTETTTDTITETDTEKERDLQTTERSEMQTEAEKTVQEQAHVDAGLQVSGSYGPSISFTASLNAGFSSSVQETQKKSTSYSREVTEKTAEKVRTRVVEEQKRRVLAEIEETNTHRIDNTAAGAKHVRGIYRWLNKIYDAQIFNYGQRMMYEFVIPEPAAFYLYATVENPPVDTDLIKPEPPMWGSMPLRPSNLTRTNYNDYVSQYSVINAPEPPSQFTVKTYFEKQDGKDTVNVGKASAVAILDGYEGYAAVVNSDYVFPVDGEKHTFHVMTGDLGWDKTPYWGPEYRTFPAKYRGEITVSAKLMHVWCFTLGVDIFCSLTAEAFAKWQLKMYDAIMQAYFDQKAAYDAKIEQKNIQKGVEIQGRNPLENRRIEKEELKKLIVMILTGNVCLNIDSFWPFNICNPSAPNEPVMDLSKVCPNGSFIRFFENAFEWQNILYVFYPYFWGRHAKWVNALQLTDPDLDFAAFLKAGAARVQIPVRPGFEKAVAFYCQTGIIWDGNDVPLIGDDLYVPIVKEITENLGKLDDGVPYPADSQPWEVTIPTSLVVLQALNEVPNIRDMMTGTNINIVNP
jgi:hypothetical protein